MSSPTSKQWPVFGLAIALLLVLFRPMAVMAQVPERGPDQVLTGTITGADHQSYKRVPFTLPEGTDRLVVAFDYDTREQKTVIDLGLEDMHGFRGASGGNKANFTVAESDATPSYLAGRLDTGEWALALAIPNIRRDVTARWTARLWFLKGAEAQVLPSPTEGRGRGWYRGDLHLHSGQSDGSCSSQRAERVPCPLFRTLEAAAARKLDFVAVTEHNTFSHAAALREAQPFFDRMLLIPGREMTTFHGHFNVFGVTSFLDFRIAEGIDNSFNDIADQVHALGGIVSINHPGLPSGEICMGCGWTMPGVDLARVDAVEIVNGSSLEAAGGDPEGALSGVEFWLDALQGHGPAAVGGSDNHDPDREGMGAVGVPVTVVEASDLSQAAILDGIRRGRVFVALTDDPGLRLDFAARTGRGHAVMGGALRADTGQAVTIEIDASGPPGSIVELVNGVKVVESFPLEPSMRTTLEPDAGAHRLRLRLRDPAGRVQALSNAIVLEIG